MKRANIHIYIDIASCWDPGILFGQFPGLGVGDGHVVEVGQYDH